MEKPQYSRFGIPNVLWLAATLSLLMAGGCRFVPGSPTLAKAAEAPESAVAKPPAPPVVDQDEEEGGLELATFMGRLQIVTHKLNLSVLAENPELSAFYLHEVEEVLEQIEALFPHHDGYPLGEMVGAFALRALDPVEEAVAAGNWAFAAERFGRFVESCNACHGATGHPFVKISMTEMNPFNQDFGSSAKLQ